MREAIQRVLLSPAVPAGEKPAVGPEVMVENDEFDDGLEAFEGADDVCPMCKGTAEAQIEVIPAFFWGEFRAWFARD